MILGYPGLKEFGFRVDCTEDSLVREGDQRIMCHSMGAMGGFIKEALEAGQYSNVNIPMTRSEQAKNAVKVKNGKVHVPISKHVVLDPYETRMIVPLYEVFSSG